MTKNKTYLSSAVKPFLHDGDELLVAQTSISILVKQLEDDMDEMPVEILPGARLDRALEVICAPTPPCAMRQQAA